MAESLNEGISSEILSDTVDSSGVANHDHKILDSSDPYKSLPNSNGIQSNPEVNNLSFQTDSGWNDDCRNGDVGLLEIAVEAQPDLVFESDLVAVNQDQPSSGRPRVYLEKDSFCHQNEDSMSRTANVRLNQYLCSRRF